VCDLDGRNFEEDTVKRSFSTQTKLKLALLVALAANVTFEPIRRSLGEAELLSEVRSAGGNLNPEIDYVSGHVGEAAKPAETLAPATQSAAPAAPAKPKVAPSSNPDVKKTAFKDYSLLARFCDGKVQARIDFEQVESKGEVNTTAVAREVSGNAEVSGQLIGLASTPGAFTPAKIKALESEVTKDVAQRKGCPAPATETAAKSDEDIKTLEEKVAKCELLKTRKDGKTQFVEFKKDSDKQRCLINRISRLDSSKERDESGRRRTKDSSAEIERIVRSELRSDINRLLKSEDESKSENGRELADDTIEAIRQAQSSGEISLQKASRLINSLEGMKSGAEVARLSRERREEAQIVRGNIADAKSEFDRNPMDFSARAQLQNAYNDALSLNWEIEQQIIRGPYQDFNWYSRNSSMASEDVRDYLAPYRQLRQEMDAMLLRIHGRSGPGSQAAMPGDLFSQRAGRDFGMNRLNGFSDIQRYNNMPPVPGQMNSGAPFRQGQPGGFVPGSPTNLTSPGFQPGFQPGMQPGFQQPRFTGAQPFGSQPTPVFNGFSNNAGYRSGY